MSDRGFEIRVLERSYLSRMHARLLVLGYIQYMPAHAFSCTSCPHSCKSGLCGRVRTCRLGQSFGGRENASLCEHGHVKTWG